MFLLLFASHSSSVTANNTVVVLNLCTALHKTKSLGVIEGFASS